MKIERLRTTPSKSSGTLANSLRHTKKSKMKIGYKKDKWISI
jgi:hypothetical protein